jgi:hypothetical protein
MESLKPAQWRLGIDFTMQSQNLQCSCHGVEQIPSAGRGRTAQFVPIRFVFRNKLHRDDKLLLAFDARVLSEVLRRGVGLGKIMYEENYATLKVKTPTGLDLSNDHRGHRTSPVQNFTMWMRRPASGSLLRVWSTDF